jgi:hypothetical protein
MSPCPSQCWAVVARWTRVHVVMGSNPGESFFYAAAMLLFYIMQRITTPKLCIFRKSITLHHCMPLLQVALVSIPPHRFVRPPCWYYRLFDIKKYDFRVDTGGIPSIPNFIQIRPSVLELNHADRQTDRHDQSYFLCVVQRTHGNL